MDLKARRKALGLSQADVATRLGVSQPTYSLIETGKKPLAEYMDKLKAIGLVEGGIVKPEIDKALLASMVPQVAPTEVKEPAPTIVVQTKSKFEKPFDPVPYKNAKRGQGVKFKNCVGTIRNFEHSGKPRYVVSVEGVDGYYVWPVDESEVLPESEPPNK